MDIQHWATEDDTVGMKSLGDKDLVDILRADETDQGVTLEVGSITQTTVDASVSTHQ